MMLWYMGENILAEKEFDRLLDIGDKTQILNDIKLGLKSDRYWSEIQSATKNTKP
jgi:hypothetical protein